MNRYMLAGLYLTIISWKLLKHKTFLQVPTSVKAFSGFTNDIANTKTTDYILHTDADTYYGPYAILS